MKKILAITIFGLLCFSVFVLPLPQITKATDSGLVDIMSAHLPWKLTQSSAIWDGKNAYIFGGGNEEGPKNTILRYDTVNDEISVMLATLPDPVTDPCAIYDGRYAYVFGGWTGQPIYSDKIARYDPTTDTVTVMAAKLPTHSMSAVWDGHSAYLFGGWDGFSYYNQILRYDPVKDEITTMNAKFPTGIKWTSAVWTGTYAYIFGGNKDYATPTDEIFRYDPVADSVIVMTAKLPAKLYFTSAVWTGTYALIFGGGSYPIIPVTSDKIMKYEPASDSVTLMDQTLPTPRGGTSAIWDSNSAFIFGGDDGTIILDEIVRYTPGGPQPAEEILDLIAIVKSMNLQQGISNSLDSKLQNVLDSLNALNSNQRNDAVNKLVAFINAVEAQSGNKLTTEQADYLMTKAQNIIDLILG